MTKKKVFLIINIKKKTYHPYIEITKKKTYHPYVEIKKTINNNLLFFFFTLIIIKVKIINIF